MSLNGLLEGEPLEEDVMCCEECKQRAVCRTYYQITVDVKSAEITLLAQKDPVALSKYINTARLCYNCQFGETKYSNYFPLLFSTNWSNLLDKKQIPKWAANKEGIEMPPREGEINYVQRYQQWLQNLREKQQQEEEEEEQELVDLLRASHSQEEEWEKDPM